MSLKQERHQEILHLIQNKVIENQEHLLEELEKLGIQTTQTTISRDIKELNIARVRLDDGTYAYKEFQNLSATAINRNDEHKLLDALKEYAIDIKYVQFMIIIKTHNLTANVLGDIIDGVESDDILGTQAGYDTIFVATPSNEIAEKLALKWKEVIDL